MTSLSHQGVLFVTDLPGDQKSQLLTLEGDDGKEYWVGFHNFFVITRYKHQRDVRACSASAWPGNRV